MPRSGYEPEIKASMGTSRSGRVNTSPSRGSESSADRLRDKARGIAEGGAQDTKLDAQPANQARPPKMQMQTAPSGNMPPDAHHVAAATSIAHAILGRRPGGM